MLQLGHAPLKLADVGGVVKLVGGVVVEVVGGLQDEAVEPALGDDGVEEAEEGFLSADADSVLTLLLLFLVLAAAAKAVVRLLYE